ncbi:flagellar biosynthesis protein FlhA [Paracoccus isoporae]|uniref:Flagellar biosynthesis protein FlhA n=1 Tax=Paracoccus isoporae TaxID=591205 RepID=A0A1G6Z647_9RHOB|nr:FHIPEP family type III secretion protein [Paracoccus isoporae]SDD98108.1 flagellar biosynthesis protein FlhA [Paracoccus isoporae]
MQTEAVRRSWDQTGLRSAAMTGGLVLVVMTMVVPIPPVLMDFGIAISIATATMILVMASTVARPTDFQAFPVMLLVSLVIRLSLNVSSTRLILTEGQTGPGAAGHVISGFSEFVAGGSVLTGLTIFAVISAVNFIVITKGAGRMAEVSARFALDSLPGRQLAIDGDLNCGAIDHEEAKRRREHEQREIAFFGSLDGASKFVKGDAIAGIVIILINLLVGIATGVAVHGLSLGAALQNYAQLTIGDGLVSQVPSLITSMAAALLLSRGGAQQDTSEMVLGQAASDWRVPAVVAATMCLMSVVPGMPPLLFLALAAALGGISWHLRRRQHAAIAPDTPQDEAAPPAPRIGDELDMDEIIVEIGPDLVTEALDPARGLAARIANMRLHVARSFGIILPEIRITDDPAVPPLAYLIRVHGVVRGRGALQSGQLLALAEEALLGQVDGDTVKEPVFGTPAKWFPAEQREEVAITGATIVTPMEVLSTHLLEVVQAYLPELLTMNAMQRLISELKDVSEPDRARGYRSYFEAMLPDKLSPELLIGVLRQMLAERISIRNLPLIVDAVHECREAGSPAQVYEAIRPRLRGQITQAFAGRTGELAVLQLHPDWEAAFVMAEEQANRPQSAALPVAELNRQLLQQLRAALPELDMSRAPVLAVADHRRRQVRDILRAYEMDLPVLALSDIDPAANVSLVAVIERGGC